MCDTSAVNYLKSIVNRRENLGDLLCLYIRDTKSTTGAVFLQENNTNLYTCLKFIDINGKNIDCSIEYKNVLPISYISTDKEPIESTYPIETCLIIPIIREDVLGVVCLFNRPEGYKEEILEEVSPYIALTQLFLTIEKKNQERKTNETTTFSKDLFLANMSHEIRTPANGVIGYGQLLLQTELSTTQKHYLQSQNQCCLQLMQLINDVLDFSKLSSGQMSINVECFRVKELVSILTETIGQRIGEKRQKLTFIVSDNVPEFIILDKHKLIQIMINLIINACKFTDLGGYIEVTINILENNMLQLAVKDNGIGISEEDQTKLFNAFEQVQSYSCKVGTGLGLTICKKLANLLNGYISVTSKLGLGSTFIVAVKYKPYEDYEKDVENDYNNLKDKIVLLVDDNTDNRIILSDMLFEIGMKPIVCASALEALRMILGDRYVFSIGLIDICMPSITGTELAQQIKQERPLFPMIALSSLDTFISTKNFECKLDKPINKMQLYDAIYKIISKKTTIDAYIGDDYESNNNSDIALSTLRINYENKKILIAEDVIYNRNLLENMIEILGYQKFEYAVNGKEALDMVNNSIRINEPYNIVLLDLRMPIMDGFTFIEEIKKQVEIIPEIIVITASILVEDKQRCKKLGIKYFINKPIDLTQLREVLLYVMERQK